MCPITENPDRADVNERVFTGATVAVSTTAVELKAGAARAVGRQGVFVFVDGNTGRVYIGPSGVTASGANKGVPWEAGEKGWFPIGDNGLYAITASGSLNVIVQEMG
jgi:hypothetical protein